MNFQATTLFCEDIREEKSGTDTLVGVLLDNIQVPQIPGLLAKLAIYTRIAISAEEQNLEPVELKLRFPDGSERMLATVDIDFWNKAKEDSKATSPPTPLLGVISRTVAAPFPVLIEGRVLSIAKTPSQETIIGQLGIKRGS